MSRSTICTAVYDRLASVGLATPNAGPRQRHHRLPGPRLLRARDCALDPDRPAHFGAIRRRRARARDRAAEDQDFRLHQRLRPSSRRPHRHPRPRARGRGDLSDHARRLRRRDGLDRPDHRPRLLLREDRRCDRDGRRHLYGPQRTAPEETFLQTFRRVGMAPFKEALYERNAGSDIYERAGRQAVRRRDRRLAARDPLRARQAGLAAAARDRGPVSRPHRARLVSFGADSAVLLHMVSGIDKATPVVFVDTGQHFPETLAYRDRLVDARPDQRSVVAAPDAATDLPPRTPKNSCSRAIPTAAAKSARFCRSPARSRATKPGSPAARDSRASSAREMPLFEAEGERVKVNPLAAGAPPTSSPTSSEAGLPPHPLVAKGLSLDRLPALHQPGAAGRGRARRPLARPGEDRVRHSSRHARRGRQYLMALWREGGFADNLWTRRRRRRADAGRGRGGRSACSAGGASARSSRSARRRSASRFPPARTRSNIWRRPRTGRSSR